MKVHKLADLFPDMSESDFATLVADIKANGLREPITTYEDAIIDGKHRHKACAKAKVKPTFDKYEGDDPLGFVISKNLSRRHLDLHDKALIAAEITGLKSGDNQWVKVGSPALSIPDAAKLLNVSADSIKRARKILQDGSAKLIAEVRAGKVPLSHAAAIAALEKRDQSNPRKRKAAVTKAMKKRKSRDPNKEAPLNSFAWSMANHALRQKWIDSVGVKSIWEAMSDAQRDELYKVAEASDTNELGVAASA